MNCPKCGRPINEVSSYCKKCDQVVSVAPGQAPGQAPGLAVSGSQEMHRPVVRGLQEAPRPTVSGQVPGPYPQKSRRKKWRRILWIILPIVLILGILLFYFLTTKQKIHLNDYLIIEFEGYDSLGEAKAEIDWERLYEENNLGESFSPEKLGDFSDFGYKEIKELAKGVISEFNKESQLNVLKSMIQLHLEPKENLSNGDVINYKFEIAPELEDFIEDMAIRFTFEDGSLTVSELVELERFDAFTDIQIFFNGVSPYGVAVFENKSDRDRGLIYEFDRVENLKNGDRITLKIIPESVEYVVKNYGQIPAEMEKTYTVSGLMGIVEQSSDLDAQTLDVLQKEARDLFLADWARNEEGEKKIQAFTYLGNYILKAKERSKSVYNELILVYRVKVQLRAQSDKETYKESMTYYWAVTYPNVSIDPHGRVSTEEAANIGINSNFKVSKELRGYPAYHNWYFRGFDTYSELYRKTVMAKFDKYFVSEDIDRDREDEELSKEMEILNDEDELEVEGRKVEDRDNSDANYSDKSVESEYILPDSSKRLLSMSDLRGLSKWEAMVARNEIFARHGRRFKMEKLQKHFDNCSWYHGTISPDKFNPNVLNDIEQKNIDLILLYEENMGYR